MTGAASRLGIWATCAALIAGLPAPTLSATAAPAPLEIASPAGEPCGAEVQLEALLARDPEMAARRAMIEALVLEAQQKGLMPPKPGRPGFDTNPVYTIPTVVHIIHTGINSPENISDAQVQSQIAAINRDLQNLPGNTTPANDCKIQLCLVNKDSLGNSSWAGLPGITRHQDGTATIAMDVPSSEQAIKLKGYFPSKKYLNVWVVKRITVGGGGGVIGYAYFPGTVSQNLDGIVMDYHVMGADNTGYGTFASLYTGYKEGKVFAHEVGHYLDIFHTFHQGCAGDLVADTPPEANNFWGCPQGAPTTFCGANYTAPIHNFMDYTDDACRWEFTAGQQTRMFAAIQTVRNELVSSNNLIAVGACPPSVFAFITPSLRQQCVNQPISFSAPTCTGTCTFTWTFQDGTGNTSTQNTSATFSSPGLKLVTLSVSNGSQTSNASITVFITACTPITGPCTNWVFGNKARLNFATGLPVAVAGTKNNGPECATQISSSTGSLLFYTDNDTIWNVNNQIMGGWGPTHVRGRSSHTGALAVPMPNTPNFYYLLSVKEWEKRNTPTIPPLAITTIDMTGNGGLGQVMTNATAVVLDSSNPPLGLLEGITAIPQCDGKNWWVITCGADSVNAQFDWQRSLYVTSVTSAGAVSSQTYPSGFTGLSGGFSAWGTITASRDGTRIAVSRSDGGEVHIFYFNRNSGVPTLVFNSGNIQANQDVEFSPDGQLIYYTYHVGSIDTFANGSYGVRQLDTNNPTQIRTLIPAAGITKPIDLQLGPDDKIYIARSSPATWSALDVINFPNNLNATNNSNECGLNLQAIPLGGAVTINQSGALPNTISLCKTTVPPASFTYAITNCKTVIFKTPSCGPWDWNFGDGNQLLNAPGPIVSHTYTNTVTTTFNVTLTAVNANPTTMTQQVTIGAQPISISGPGSACGGPLNYSVIGPSSYTYAWTITGGSPPSATGNNVFVNWGLGATATIQVTGTDPATGCTVTATKTVDPCANCTAPPANMVAWWPLDEAAGSTAQEIVNARDGTDVGAPVKVLGPVGYSRLFSGTGQYIQASHHAKLDLGTGNFTIDAWIKTPSNPPYAGIVEKRSLSPDRGYALYLKDCQLALLIGDGTTSTEFVAGNSLPLCDNQWHHVAATEDRNNASAGTTLYVDGVAVMALPAFMGSGSLDNTENLLIGAREPSSSPTSLWVGGIDEVEIFTRALGADEVAKIYGSGAGGKCKEFVYVPTAKTICYAEISTDVTFSICNYTAASQNYALSFAGATGTGCTFAGPTTFAILSTNTNGVISNVGPGCQFVVVRIFKPNGMGAGDVSCYTITAVNTSSNVSRTTNGQIWANDALCPHLTSKTLSAVGVGVVVSHTFQIQNSSPAPQVVGIQVSAMGVDQPPLVGGGVVSLNGLPPGVPWFTTYVLVPGESTLVNVDAQFVDAAPFIPYDIVLAADIDGNGMPDAEAAAGMINTERGLNVAAVPPGAASLPTRFDLADTWPNPFHRVLVVAFDLPRASSVNLELYDVSGRRVRSVIEARVEAGRIQRVLDGNGLHSGVYLLRIESQGQVRTRRVVMLKK